MSERCPLNLKLNFCELCPTYTSASTDEPRTDERSELKWKSKNSDLYPDEIKYNRSEGLLKFIENITKDLKSNLKKNERNFWNNLSNDQRKALLHLSNDDSIIIKSADKGVVIVIVDTDKYESECLKTLSDPVFYEELPSDPNPSYRQATDETVDNLLSDQIIDEFEAELMKDGVVPLVFMDCPESTKILILFLHSGQSVVVSIPVHPKFPNSLTFSSNLLHNKIHHMLETLLISLAR